MSVLLHVELEVWIEKYVYRSQEGLTQYEALQALEELGLVLKKGIRSESKAEAIFEEESVVTP